MQNLMGILGFYLINFFLNRVVTSLKKQITLVLGFFLFTCYERPISLLEFDREDLNPLFFRENLKKNFKPCTESNHLLQ